MLRLDRRITCHRGRPAQSLAIAARARFDREVTQDPVLRRTNEVLIGEQIRQRYEVEFGAFSRRTQVLMLLHARSRTRTPY